jgi:hypothetical protein
MTTEEARRLAQSSPAIQGAIEILQQEISRLTNDEKEAGNILSSLLNLSNVRPAGWSPNSHAGYYKEKYGKLLLKWLAEMEAHPDKNLIIETKKVNRSRETIRNIVSQAWDWLIANERDDEQRQMLVTQRSSLHIKKVATGVMLSRRTTADEEENFITTFVAAHGIKTEDIKRWKTDILTFTENAEDGQKIVLDGLVLEPYDIDWLKNYIKESKCLFPIKIMTSVIELIKHKELWSKMNEDKEA